jgi:deoxyribodipyrimidine photo-lyase
MEHALRIEENPVLAYAIEEANKYNKPILIFYALDINSPYLNYRHYHFILEGLNQLRRNLFTGGIQLHIELIDPLNGIKKLSKGAIEIIADFGYLREEQRTREQLALRTELKVTLIESELIVPVEVASNKEQYAARTFRPLIRELYPDFLSRTMMPKVNVSGLNLQFPDNFSFYPAEDNFIKYFNTVSYNQPVAYKSGERSAASRLNNFIQYGLDQYNEGRNLVHEHFQSGLSPYLHFGQISPVKVAHAINSIESPGRETYLEQLIVRRELSYNFVWYNQSYDSFQSLPAWAQQTLLEHASDPRPYTYTLDQLKNAETHDPYWNAAQKEMVVTGKMHGYMRMYWGKKILEWTKDPIDAYNIALYLNNYYSLDGYNPNGYAGVAWCFGKHDRPWKSRPVFGTIRYMNAAGLERKFEMEKYLNRIAAL